MEALPMEGLAAEAYFARGMRVWVYPLASEPHRYAAVVSAPPGEDAGAWQVRREQHEDGAAAEELVPYERLRPRAAFGISAAERANGERHGRPDQPAATAAAASVIASTQQACRKRRQSRVSSSSSSSDDEPTEEEKVYWTKAEEILREYSLSKMAMGAARLWIKEMGHPEKGKSLHRVQVWFLHRMQGRKRSPPLSSWQGGCPEIIPKLRALPWWSSTHLEWLPKLQAPNGAGRSR